MGALIVARVGVRLWKSRAVGASADFRLHANRLSNVCQLYEDALAPHACGLRKNDLAVLVRKLPLVLDGEQFVVKRKEARDSRVVFQCMPDVVDLPPFVLAVRGREEGCLVVADGTRRYVDELPVSVAPDGMKLRLDVQTGHFVNGPADHTCAASLAHDAIDDQEAFVDQPAVVRGEEDAGGGALRFDAPAEVLNMRKPRVGGDVPDLDVWSCHVGGL